ncbi:P-loop containing nucleoside triphosphate hydrolase protein [Acaromyces ingoldii]|uniref:P-loop containing nucleoside triphosphate hydrolase protein n=1 Tax=Acaromyces ingoldii TaxID=215250 RepID=A0A316YDS3_9BASI|nr:P-loop containing nucleoside triphosphate hydrolase protein [Acaromyces ingoldii]PWN87750.1 P-loop containing nucleoside triphosphate hydrolase protein [Acaromyces ingoldii]
MPLPESKKNVGLGRALINRRNKEAASRPHSSFHTTDLANPRSGGPGLESVTHQGDLEEFLSTAQLAEADFTAERRNVSVVQAPDAALGQGKARRHNPFLLSGQEEKEVLRRQAGNRKRLRVPRRPAWNDKTTKDQLRRAEADAFLDWRRGLAELTEAQNFVLTPFERNLEVWRQLWRVVERSHLVVQIVDARNPLRFRCEDLEDYVDNMPVRLGGPAPEGDSEGEEEEDDEDEDETAPSTSSSSSSPSKKGKRKNLLLINKADLLDEGQRQEWARYFEEHGIEYAFFSAANAAALQAARAEAEALAARRAEYGESDEDDEDEDEAEDEDEEDEGVRQLSREAKAVDLGARDAKPLVGQEAAEHVLEANRKVIEQTLQRERAAGGMDNTVEAAAETAAGAGALKDAADGTEANKKANDPTRVLNVLELEELFMARAPPLQDFETPEHGVPTKLVVGLVGYPNVGKSSTINALLGEKKVSVSSTPGHTKHFQTIALSPSVTLCDCPGLVFPQFATTSADLVVDGVLPIDQMREYTAPAELVARRIPKDVIEGTYGFRIEVEHPEEGGSGEPTGLELLTAYAIARGFARQGQGNPDESRAARYVLKDYVNAKLLFAHPPPGTDPDDFNAAQRARARAALAGRRFAPTAAVPSGEQTIEEGQDLDDIGLESFNGDGLVPAPAPQGKKSSALDRAFFDSGASARPAYKGRARPATDALRGRINPDGTAAATKADGSSSTQPPAGMNAGKKHFKGNKRKKQRSGQGYA